MLDIDVSGNQLRVRIVGKRRRVLEQRPGGVQPVDVHVQRRTQQHEIALRAEMLLQ